MAALSRILSIWRHRSKHSSQSHQKGAARLQTKSMSRTKVEFSHEASMIFITVRTDCICHPKMKDVLGFLEACTLTVLVLATKLTALSSKCV